MKSGWSRYFLGFLVISLHVAVFSAFWTWGGARPADPPGQRLSRLISAEILPAPVKLPVPAPPQAVRLPEKSGNVRRPKPRPASKVEARPDETARANDGIQGSEVIAATEPANPEGGEVTPGEGASARLADSKAGGAKPAQGEASPDATAQQAPDVPEPPAMVGSTAVTLAAFPTTVTTTFAVHAPKDYLESGGPSGSAEVRVESVSNGSGQADYNIRIEIRLGWLLNKVVGGSLVYQTQGRATGSGLQTRRYSEKVGERPERWLETVAGRSEMNSHQAKGVQIPSGAQDRLSAIWLLSMVARGDPSQLDKGKRFTVPMLSFRKVYPAHFESLGSEVLLAPSGVLQTLHVRYFTDEPDSDKVDIWLGYDYEMQPVRIRWQEAEGRVIDLILSKKP